MTDSANGEDATIVALSSGRPPAAIGVIRISGGAALAAATGLAGALPSARQAGLRTLRDASGEVLDRALVVAFPGPATATGEDLVELHCHGGRAVIAAVEAALVAMPGVRRAEPGEFTRRALVNGRIDLAEAEGLADLLAAETERQRRVALEAATGGVTRRLTGWMSALATFGAQVEVAIDYVEDGDEGRGALGSSAAALLADMRSVLAQPPVDRVRDGLSVVVAGPPNAGKSTLVNALAQRDVAIVSPVAGTTRDRIEAPVQRSGLMFVLSDTAGLTLSNDPIEAIGVERAHASIAAADLLLWLGDGPPPRDDAIALHARADLPDRGSVPDGRLAVSARDDPELAALWQAIVDRADTLVPSDGSAGLTMRQRARVAEAADDLARAIAADDLLIAAEELRVARGHLGVLLGIDATEAMLDSLFARFCLGK